MVRPVGVPRGTDAPGEWADLQRALEAALRVGAPPPCTFDPDAWFVYSQGAQSVAAQRCAGCLALFECGAYALAAGEGDGVWGGLTEADRQGGAVGGVA